MINKYQNTVLYRLTSPHFSVFRTRGRALAALFGGSICVGSLIIASNTIGLSWIKSLFLVQRKGNVVVPAAHLKTLSQTALTDLNLLNNNKAVAKLFSSDSEVVEAFGTLTSSYGAIIGIPTYINANSIEEVVLDETLKRPMTAEEKEMLAKVKENSVFSDLAKVYIISEGLATVRDSDHFVFPSITTSLCFIGGFLNGAVVARWFKLTPFLNRVPVYMLSLCTWACIALFFSELYKEYLFSRMLNDFNEKCIDGGIEFYEKSLERHELRKNLFGLNGIGFNYMSVFMSRRLSKLRERKEKLLS